MQTQIEFFQWTRTNILHLLDNLTKQQLNQIPAGHNNNILWHAGHVHFAQQLLVYHLSGHLMDIPEGYADRYASGTKPHGDADSDEIKLIISKLKKFRDQFPEDCRKGIFQTFKPFDGQYFHVNYEFRDWETSFAYNNIHEAVHLGHMRSLAIQIGTYAI